MGEASISDSEHSIEAEGVGDAKGNVGRQGIWKIQNYIKKRLDLTRHVSTRGESLQAFCVTLL